MSDEDRRAARRALLWGWSLFALFVVLFAASFGVALLYLQLD